MRWGMCEVRYYDSFSSVMLVLYMCQVRYCGQSSWGIVGMLTWREVWGELNWASVPLSPPYLYVSWIMVSVPVGICFVPYILNLLCQLRYCVCAGWGIVAIQDEVLYLCQLRYGANKSWSNVCVPVEVMSPLKVRYCICANWGTMPIQVEVLCLCLLRYCGHTVWGTVSLPVEVQCPFKRRYCVIVKLR